MARLAFPRGAAAADDVFMTDLMADPSDAVVLEGDNPLHYVDLRGEGMHEPTETAGLPLFREAPHESPDAPNEGQDTRQEGRDARRERPVASIQPWRPSPADGWTHKPPSPRALESHYPDLLRRDLEFLMALRDSGTAQDSPAVGSFEERHRELVGQLVRWREAQPDPAAAAAETARRALETVEKLAGLRKRILEELEPARRRKALAAESRARVPGEWAERIDALVEFERAEARGEVVEIELPAAREPWSSSGFIGADDVEALLRHHLERMKAEQERVPLPARGRLSTLLRQLPVVWLDAIWEALDLGSEPPAHRKERERRIARHLSEPGTPRRIVEGKLSTDDRRLLGYLLEMGGQASGGSVTRRFGSDRGDGWFWNEEAPGSSLGRLRLHGLAFVGTDASSGRRRRTVLVPPALRGSLGAALDAHHGARPSERWDAGEDSGTGHLSEANLRADVLETLENVFPDGVIEPARDEAWLTERLPGVSEGLVRLPATRLLYHRAPGGGWDWGEEVEVHLGDASGWEKDDWIREERSYGLFFLSPTGDGFRFEFESEFPDEGGHLRTTTGVGRIGYAVAVSTLAPFALLRVTSLDIEDEIGAVSLPDIIPRMFHDAGHPLPEEGFLREVLDEDAVRVLEELEGAIVRVLGKAGIAQLPEEEAEKHVPWLDPGDCVLVDTGRVTVEDALFFRYL